MMTTLVETTRQSEMGVEATSGDTLFLFDYGDGPKFGTSPLNPNATITFNNPGPDQPLQFLGDVPFVDPDPMTNQPLKIQNQTRSYHYTVIFKERLFPMFLSVTGSGVDTAEFNWNPVQEVWRVALKIKSEVEVPVFFVNNLGSVDVEFLVTQIPSQDPVPVERLDANRYVTLVGVGRYRVKQEQTSANPGSPYKIIRQAGGTDEADIIIDP